MRNVAFLGNCDHMQAHLLDITEISFLLGITSLQKYMRCKNGCYVSMRADQPAEVAEDAPSHLVRINMSSI